MDENRLYIKITIENTISTTNEIIVISDDSETEDDTTKCQSIAETDDKIIEISDEEVLDSETTKPSPSLINNAQLAINAKKTDDSGASGQVSMIKEQPRSSLLSTLLTEEELRLREPLPPTSESEEYDAEVEQQTVARVKRLTKKRRVQVSVSDITINIEKKLKVILD